MGRVQELIRDVVRQIQNESLVEMPMHIMDTKLTEDGVIFEFRNGRQQQIRVSQQAEHYRLTSVILKHGYVEKIGRDKILPFIWQRNRETDLVSFCLDKQGRLVGTIEQLTETADSGEMILYLKRLAWECDQLEYLLIGTENP